MADFIKVYTSEMQAKGKTDNYIYINASTIVAFAPAHHEDHEGDPNCWIGTWVEAQNLNFYTNLKEDEMYHYLKSI